nr:hypothetical protein Iba_scaffold8100CG0020 [Ipomoea batatas]
MPDPISNLLHLCLKPPAEILIADGKRVVFWKAKNLELIFCWPLKSTDECGTHNPIPLQALHFQPKFCRNIVLRCPTVDVGDGCSDEKLKK